MFKLIRDSIFYPKNIIFYRAKKPLFTILYIIFISLLLSISYGVKPFSYTGLSYNDRSELVKSFKNNNARIQNGVFYTDESFVVSTELGDIGFVKNDESPEAIETLTLFVVSNDKIYQVVNAFVRTVSKEISTILEQSPNLLNVDLTNINENSDFFVTINSIIARYQPLMVVSSMIDGFINGVLTMLMFALAAYVLMVLFFRAQKYMKKGQLYKMLIFSTTLIVIVECFNRMIGMGGLLEIILMFVSIIPVYKLQKEFIARIRMKELGREFGNNQSFIDKINEMIGNKEDDNEDDSNEE